MEDAEARRKRVRRAAWRALTRLWRAGLELKLPARPAAPRLAPIPVRRDP